MRRERHWMPECPSSVTVCVICPLSVFILSLICCWASPRLTSLLSQSDKSYSVNADSAHLTRPFPSPFKSSPHCRYLSDTFAHPHSLSLISNRPPFFTVFAVTFCCVFLLFPPRYSRREAALMCRMECCKILQHCSTCRGHL